MEHKAIGDASNYYGGLLAMEYDGKYYWAIENFDSDFDNLEDWDEIDKELYDSLIAYQERLDKKRSYRVVCKKTRH